MLPSHYNSEEQPPRQEAPTAELPQLGVCLSSSWGPPACWQGVNTGGLWAFVQAWVCSLGRRHCEKPGPRGLMPGGWGMFTVPDADQRCRVPGPHQKAHLGAGRAQRALGNVLPHMKQQIRNFLLYFYCKICTDKVHLVWKSVSSEPVGCK